MFSASTYMKTAPTAASIDTWRIMGSLSISHLDKTEGHIILRCQFAIPPNITLHERKSLSSQVTIFVWSYTLFFPFFFFPFAMIRGEMSTCLFSCLCGNDRDNNNIAREATGCSWNFTKRCNGHSSYNYCMSKVELYTSYSGKASWKKKLSVCEFKRSVLFCQ